MPATPAWLAAVEALLNRGVRGSMQATAIAHRLEGTALRVDVLGLISIRVAVAAGRLALVAADRPVAAGQNESPPAAAVDATISGSLAALLRLAQSQAGRAAPGRPGSEAQAGTARAAIRGDAEIANSYRQLIVLALPDWEEELSHLVGDLPARRLSQFARHAVSWARKARATAGENVAEYLQEESRDLVGRTELDEFLQGVDALREAADRAAARLAGLERRLKGGA